MVILNLESSLKRRGIAHPPLKNMLIHRHQNASAKSPEHALKVKQAPRHDSLTAMPRRSARRIFFSSTLILLAKLGGWGTQKVKEAGEGRGGGDK